LIDEGRSLIEEVVDAEIALRIGEPSMPTVEVKAKIEIDRQRQVRCRRRREVRTYGPGRGRLRPQILDWTE
jgi:hypothetical protein